MIFFPWDEIHSLEINAEEALKQARTKDFKRIRDEYIDRVTEAFETDYMLGIYDVESQLGRSIDPDYADIKAVLERKIDGKTYIDRISDYFEDGTPYDIGRVIATDAHRIYNEAMFEGAKSAGATSKTWNTMADPKVRDTHAYLEGVTVPIDAEFYSFNGDSTYYPGQWGIAEEDINCRCWLTYSK